MMLENMLHGQFRRFLFALARMLHATGREEIVPAAFDVFLLCLGHPVARSLRLLGACSFSVLEEPYIYH